MSQETDLNFKIGRTPIIPPNPASHSPPPPQVHSDPSNSLSSESDGRTLSSLDTAASSLDTAASSVQTGVVKLPTPICAPDHTTLRRIFTDAFLGLVGQKPHTVQDREFRELEFKRHLQTFIPKSDHYIVDDVYCFFLGFIPDVPEQMNHDALDRLVRTLMRHAYAPQITPVTIHPPSLRVLGDSDHQISAINMVSTSLNNLSTDVNASFKHMGSQISDLKQDFKNASDHGSEDLNKKMAELEAKVDDLKVKIEASMAEIARTVGALKVDGEKAKAMGVLLREKEAEALSTGEEIRKLRMRMDEKDAKDNERDAKDKEKDVLLEEMQQEIDEGKEKIAETNYEIAKLKVLAEAAGFVSLRQLLNALREDFCEISGETAPTTPIRLDNGKYAIYRSHWEYLRKVKYPNKEPWQIVKLVLDAFQKAVTGSQDPKHVLYASLCVNGNKTSIRVLVFGLSEGSKGKDADKKKKVRTRGLGNTSAHPDFDIEDYKFAIQEFAPARDSNFLSAGLAAAYKYSTEPERKKKNEEIAQIAKKKGYLLFK